MQSTPSTLPEPAFQVCFAGFTLDLTRRTLLDASGAPVELRPQAYEVLRVLCRHAGQVVTKQELLAAVWPDVVVTDDSLVQAIGDVRQALGEAGHRVIKTVSRRGYMLVPERPPGPVANELAPRKPARRRWATVGLACIALAALAAGVWTLGSRDRTDAAQRPSIAVLAFKGPPDDADGAAMARDVAAELVAELGRSPDLRVLSAQSSFQVASAHTPLTDIGRVLRSRYIVDGSVRRSGEQLRIAVELLDSRDDQIVWSTTYQVDRTGMATMQQELVGRIAGTLQARVARTEEHRALARAPRSLDVIVLTAHGKAMMQRYSAQGVHEARRLLGQALELDPQYAPAWAFLGMTDTIDIGLKLTGEWDTSRFGEMLAHVQRAIALQPDLTVAYVALSQAHGLTGDFDAALAAAQQCVRLSPNDAGCFYVLGAAQLRMGRTKDAVRNLAQATERNPLAPAFLPAFYATALWADGQLNEALHVSSDCLAKAAEFSRCRVDRISALVELGRIGEARAEAARLVAMVPTMTARQFAAGFADSALVLRERRVAVAQQVGLPSGAELRK